MSYLNREIELPGNQTFFMFGPRQTGKSTLLQKRFHSNVLVYDLLETDTYQRLISNPEIFRHEVMEAVRSSGIVHVIIDEVQRIPALLNEVHLLVESKIRCSFILSGSSARKLKRAHANMLAGRAWSYKLFGFSVSEIKDNFNLMDLLRYGSLPPVFMAESRLEKEEILRSYVSTYMETEIQQESQLRNIGAFFKFLSLAANQNTECLNYSNIAREAGVRSKTVKAYYEILVDTLLGFYLYPYGRSLRKKMSLHPKFYFFDTGVANAINRKIKIPIEKNSRELGQLFENLIVYEIKKINEYGRLDWELSFYRTEAGAEVDCIITTPAGRIIAIEIKSTMSPAKKHCKGLVSFAEVCPETETILACRCPKPFSIGKIQVTPWQNLLSNLKNIV